MRTSIISQILNQQNQNCYIVEAHKMRAYDLLKVICNSELLCLPFFVQVWNGWYEIIMKIMLLIFMQNTVHLSWDSKGIPWLTDCLFTSWEDTKTWSKIKMGFSKTSLKLGAHIKVFTLPIL